MKNLFRFSIAAVIILTLLSLLVVTSTPTSKVTWEDQRGFPLPFLLLGRYTGPCGPSELCNRLSLKSFNLENFLLDLVVFAIVGGFAYPTLTHFRKRKQPGQEIGAGAQG